MLEPRVYTIAQARRTLPLVRRIVADIVEAARQAEAATEAEEGERWQARIARCARELEELGVELKDPGMGLVDFYWKRGEELAYLCWRHGEDGIDHWHDLEAGFAGRRPLDPVDFSLDAATPV